MPGNEVEDRLRSLYELSNSSPGLTTSQRVVGDRPVLNYKQQGNISQFRQVPFDQTFSQSNSRPEFSRHISRSNLLNSNGYTHGHQNYQRWQNQGLCSDENTETSWRNSTSASADSPTLTTNSEKSEVAEASSDFNVLGWQQQLVRGQELSSSQTPSMQQSGFNDMQMLQQNLMFKQLQELQRKQQLQQLGKQGAGGQLPLLINGTPVCDSSSQVFMNMMQRCSSPSGQGVPYKMAFSQDPNQSMRSTGLVSQKPHVSLHGTPVGSAGGVVNQYGHIQSHGLENSLNMAGSGNQTQKLIMRSTFGNPFPVDHDTFSSNNLCMPQGGFALKQGFPMKDAFGQVSPQHGTILHTNSSLPGLNLETMQQKTTELVPSQGLIPLDPQEQKFLYNMDDDSFGRSMDLDAGSFGGALELQSGSWSALMQTAVAEASSCETGVQEEWSGLTFQSTELSTDNQPSKFMGEERQQPSWADSNLQNASSNSNLHHIMLNDPSVSSSFPGFQQSGFQSSNEHGESLHQRKSINQMSQEIQPQTHLVNTWVGRNDERPQSYMHGVTLHNKVSQLYDKQKGDGVSLSMDKGRDLDGYSWTEQMEQLSFCTNKNTSKGEASQVNRFAAAPNVSTDKAHLPDRKAIDQHEYMKHVGFSMNKNENESGGETRRLPIGRNKTTNNSYEGANTAYKNFNAGPQQGHVGNSIVIDDMSKNAMNQNQGFLSNFHGNSKASEQTVLRGDLRSSSSTKFGQTFESNGQNVASRTSQHMFELLHKVDRSRENNPMAHFSTTDHTSLSESPKIDAHDTYIAQMLNQSSASQGFGLELSPPSQRLTNSSCFLPQDSSSLVQSFPPNEFSQRAHWGEKSSSSGQTNVFSNLNMPHDRSQLQTQHMNALVSGESSRATLTDTSSRFPAFSPSCSQDTPQQISQHMSARLQNIWENVPASQCMETTSLASPKGRTVSSDLGACSTNAQGSDYGEQAGIHMFRREMSSEIIDTLQSGGLHNSNHQDPDRVVYSDNHASAASERNLESLGSSSRASETLHQNYTLLRQAHAMRSSAETDPSRTATRRYNAAYSVANIQQISDIAGQQSIYEPNSRFSNQTLAGPNLSQVNQTFDQIEPQNQTRGAVYNHSENPRVNFHMAPTWFKPYDAFRNVHMQPMYDARLAKSAIDQRGIALPEQGGNISPSPTGRADETISALHVLPPDLVNQIRPSVGSKKRKSIGSEHIPWHKEVTQGSERLQDISMAEQDWAYATNRLTEKVEDDFELIGEDQPMHQRSKRRMTRTTQLIQQLLRPAPASVLLGDASSRYDSVTYLIAKVALGDACSLAYGSRKDFHAARGDNNMISEKLKAFECDEHFTKVVEDFTDRVKKLEDNFLRLESSSLLDIRLDCEDLERYSVLNRFAKFHMPGPAGTSSSATMMSPPKSSPQKWVTALPLPRNLPEDTQCISL